MKNNITATTCCFVRYYHYKNNKYRIFSDNIAEKILTEEEYKNIASSMVKGISFFNPSFKGSDEEALNYIVNKHLAPSVLGRYAFCEKSLLNAIKLGCKELLIFASGYDTLAYQNKFKNLNVFEIDKKEVLEDKISRLERGNIDYSHVSYIPCDFTKDNLSIVLNNSKYDSKQISFSSLLGITYYLSKKYFNILIKNISNNVSSGSTIIFDYQNYDRSIETQKNEILAKGANEEMKSKYTYNEIEEILQRNNFLIYEHLNDIEMTNNYFYNYNTLNPNNKIIAPKGIGYCLAVKR